MVGHGSAALHEARAKEAEVAFFDTPILFSEIGFCMALCSFIRHQGSDVYLGMSLVQNGGAYLMY